MSDFMRVWVGITTRSKYTPRKMDMRCYVFDQNRDVRQLTNPVSVYVMQS